MWDISKSKAYAMTIILPGGVNWVDRNAIQWDRNGKKSTRF